MRVNQSRNRRDAVGVNGMVSGLGQTFADGLNHTVFDEDRIRLPQRTFQLPRNQGADVFDQDRRHARTIAQGLCEEKARDKGSTISVMGYSCQR